MSQSQCWQPESWVERLSRYLRVAVTYDCNISCHLCYSRGLEDRFPHFMSPQEFERVLAWMLPQGLREVRLHGGEPTLHPQFTDILDCCERNEVSVHFPTNNLFGDRVLARLSPTLVRDVSLNYCAQEVLNPKQQERYDKNLQALKRAGISHGFLYTITPEGDEGEVLERAKQSGGRYIRITYPLAGFSRELTADGLYQNREVLEKKALRLMREGEREGIHVTFYRAIPRCFFTDDGWEALKGFGRSRVYSRCVLGKEDQYAAMAIVNPDCTAIVCIGVHIQSPPIFEFKDLQALSNYFKPHVDTLQWRTPLWERCEECAHYRDRSCQGGCLTYKEAPVGAPICR